MANPPFTNDIKTMRFLAGGLKQAVRRDCGMAKRRIAALFLLLGISNGALAAGQRIQ